MAAFALSYHCSRRANVVLSSFLTLYICIYTLTARAKKLHIERETKAHSAIRSPKRVRSFDRIQKGNADFWLYFVCIFFVEVVTEVREVFECYLYSFNVSTVSLI